MNKYILMLIATLVLEGLFNFQAFAHPGTGIIADKNGNVYFIHTGVGVTKISVDGKLTYIYKSVDGHWMCLDEKGFFANSQPKYFKRITSDGMKPAILFAGGGSPIVVNKDGNFYYCGSPNGDLHPGAKTIVKESEGNKQTILAPALEDTLNKLIDGITGLAAGKDGSLYLACWNSLLKVTMKGEVTTLVDPLVVNDCDEDPADHKEANRGLPLLRGIDIDSANVIYAAATSCHRLLKITSDGKVNSILKSERPWSPTGVAVRN